MTSQTSIGETSSRTPKTNGNFVSFLLIMTDSNWENDMELGIAHGLQRTALLPAKCPLDKRFFATGT
jgi:hypothetical protein